MEPISIWIVAVMFVRFLKGLMTTLHIHINLSIGMLSQGRMTKRFVNGTSGINSQFLAITVFCMNIKILTQAILL